MTVPFGHWPGHHIPNTVVPIGAVAGQPPATYRTGPPLSAEERANQQARDDAIIAKWQQDLAAFRAAKRKELDLVRDPIERLLRAAVSCCDVYSKTDGPEQELAWDVERLARYFPDLGRNNRFRLPDRGVGVWSDAQVKQWFLSHVPASSNQLIVVSERSWTGKRERHYPGWSFAYGSVARTNTLPRCYHDVYRRLAILTDGRVAYQADAHEAMAFTSADGHDRMNAITLREMAAICGLTDSMDEPANPLQASNLNPSRWLSG